MSEGSEYNVENPSPAKRGPGRPKKVLEAKPVDNSAKPLSGYKMAAKPNWETFDPAAADIIDRYHIPPELMAKLPEDLTFQWVIDTVMGMPERSRGTYEQSGWTPVSYGDFDGALDARFRGKKGVEINIDGAVLMARPKRITDLSKALEKKRAVEQIRIKEQALAGGDLPGVTLDTQHKTAIQSNRISKSFERIEVPEDSKDVS